ncbi:hypothetical protein H5410_062011 [Solanum commersonii]|uniref:DUF4216 domain-containing protein n=1 Tax=Solanum commersonii TaxID=4109 RepID=A0A9J5W9I9_SOLCO|nr:hypothetical protein H5410_062011 [Solanum commersonii]
MVFVYVEIFTYVGVHLEHTRKYRSYDPFIIAQHVKQVYYASCPLLRDKADWWVVIKSKPVGRIEIDNVLDVAYQNDVAIVQQQVDVELETTLQHPQHILEEVSDDEILNVEEEISENEVNHLMTKNGTIMKMKQLRRKNGRMMELKQMSLGLMMMIDTCYLGISQTKQSKKKKSRRPIDPKDIAGSISSAPERISHDTHLFALHDHCLHDATKTYLYRLFIEHDLYRQVLHLPQSDAMAGMPPLTQRFVHPDVSPSSIAAPSATPHDTMSALAPGHKDRLGRVLIEPDGSSWHPAKDAAQTLKECVRRLYRQAYHSWSEIPNSIRQMMFNNFKTMCTWESRYNLVIGTTFEIGIHRDLPSKQKSVPG